MEKQTKHIEAIFLDTDENQRGIRAEFIEILRTL